MKPPSFGGGVLLSRKQRSICFAVYKGIQVPYKGIFSEFMKLIIMQDVTKGVPGTVALHRAPADLLSSFTSNMLDGLEWYHFANLLR